MRLEFLRLGIRDGWSPPLPLVLGEHRKTRRGEFSGTVGCLKEASCDTDMGTEVFHGCEKVRVNERSGIEVVGLIDEMNRPALGGGEVLRELDG